MATAAASPGDEAREQKRRERRIVARYRYDFAWRLVAEAIWGIGGWLAMIVLAMKGVVPYWAACLVNGWIAYLMYMPLHEATHGNLSGRHGRFRWVDDAVGWISAIPLWFSYRAHQSSHMKHHAYTNDPACDPDHFFGGPLRAIVPKFLLLSLLQIAVPVLSMLPGGLRLVPAVVHQSLQSGVESPYEIRLQRRLMLLHLGIFVALSVAGLFWEALLLWYLPSRIGLLLVIFLFAWLPHHPHDERGRYRDTRITLFPGGTLLIRGQNHHLLHPMFPRVPHYRLPALFREMRPILEAHGARIEGPLAGRGAPKILMRWPGEA